jgi:putative transposase
MTRTARELIDGGIYHVVTRGNNGQRVFRAEEDFQRYLELLSGYAQTHGLGVHRFALLPGEVHLLLHVPTGRALSKAMLGLNLAYTLYHHRRYGTSGHLWHGRFKSALIHPDRLDDRGRWIELLPVQAGLAPHPDAYRWSSRAAEIPGAALAAWRAG